MRCTKQTFLCRAMHRPKKPCICRYYRVGMAQHYKVRQLMYDRSKYCDSLPIVSRCLFQHKRIEMHF
ncbi:hypothetical protein FGO68_gene9368 [Halteria grandinella]|uniref:Uncharacterized protein n=1 Tax=Halteria grandinella TaxID=5974 RepID=A0A8J8NFH7_HALGN|nr:hypothetical protein FGO68_gene9368 [Halteria grandinella]